MDLPLFDRYDVDDVTASRHGGNTESEEAKAAIAPAKSELRARVFDFVQARGRRGATTEEVSRALDMKVWSVSGRMAELKREGVLMPNGERRATTSGCSAAVIVAVRR